MNELTYTMQGDYNLPDLTMPEQPEVTLGRYAQMRRKFLKEHHKIRYYNLLTSCTLTQHLAETEQTALPLGRNPDEADGGAGGLDRKPESGGYDEVGAGNEQSEEQSAGDRESGDHLRLDYYDRSNEDKSLPFFGGDDTIREILGTTPHLKASKEEIRAFYESNPDNAARTEYIKGIFNNDYTEVILSDGRRVGYKTWQNVLQLWEGSYLSRTKQSFYDWGVIAQHFEAMRLLGELQDTMKPLTVRRRATEFFGYAGRGKNLCFFFFSGDHRRCSYPWKRRIGGKVPYL